MPPTSQQILKFPPKRVKNLATPSSIFIFISSASTGELCSQPVKGNFHRIGRMFPEHVEQSFLDTEYSFVAIRRILPSRFAKQKFAQLRTGLTIAVIVYATGLRNLSANGQLFLGAQMATSSRWTTRNDPVASIGHKNRRLAHILVQGNSSFNVLGQRNGEHDRNLLSYIFECQSSENK